MNAKTTIDVLAVLDTVDSTLRRELYEATASPRRELAMVRDGFARLLHACRLIIAYDADDTALPDDAAFNYHTAVEAAKEAIASTTGGAA